MPFLERAWWFWLAPVAATLVVVAVSWLRRRRARAADLWSRPLGAEVRQDARWTPYVLMLAALLMMVSAAGPRWGRRLVTTESRSLDLIFAVDISKSMLAEDQRPSRLGRAQAEIRRLLQDLQGDRTGLLAFSGRSYILSPLTVDGGAVRLFVDILDPDLASEGGTSLAKVLQQGAELLGTSATGGDRVLVVFTDGETQDDLTEAITRAEALRQQGMRLVLVAEGSTVPVRIPVRDTAGRFIEWQTDAEGREVESARRDDVLMQVRDAADGVLVAADVPDQAGAVRDLLAGFTRASGAETRAADLVPRAWLPALAAALVLIAATAARAGRTLLALAAISLLATRAEAQRPESARRLAEQGEPAAAAAAWLKQAGEGRSRDTAFYNAGTAAMQAGRLPEARQAFTEAAKSFDPGLRYRALYNAGLAALLEARADTANGQSLFTEAEQRLREALLLEPASARAKWNLELAQRQKPPTPPAPQRGGGGSGGGGGQSSAAPPSRMDQRQADQILESMERQERDTRTAQQRRAARSGGARDW